MPFIRVDAKFSEIIILLARYQKLLRVNFQVKTVNAILHHWFLWFSIVISMIENVKL